MAIEKVSKKYELLVRFHDDGKIGAHSQDISYFVEDGNIFSPVLDAPKPLSLAELKDLVNSLEESDWFSSAPAEA